ncbi:unnamed protein product [Psylliodes chrysocephalus]|uniref:Tubulin glycylase 3A n=1 Tax=Psylliodes chrysocephalus TaxID=3402493 RepID=A0A9P0GC90_9CUCU|nr:unnamed protein product [Psylliodes chrysocephala]
MMTDDYDLRKNLPSSTLEALETEITEILATCQNVVDKDTRIRLKQINNGNIFDYDTNTNIEKLAQDMTCILENFKQHLSIGKPDNDSRLKKKVKEIHDEKYGGKRKLEQLRKDEREKVKEHGENIKVTDTEDDKQAEAQKIKDIEKLMKQRNLDDRRPAWEKMTLDPNKKYLELYNASFLSKNRLLMPPEKSNKVITYKFTKTEGKTVTVVPSNKVSEKFRSSTSTSLIEKSKIVQKKSNTQKPNQNVKDVKTKSAKTSRDSSPSKKNDLDSNTPSRPSLKRKIQQRSSSSRSKDLQKSVSHISKIGENVRNCINVPPLKPPVIPTIENILKKTFIASKPLTKSLPRRSKTSISSNSPSVKSFTKCEKPSNLVITTHSANPGYSFVRTSSNSLSGSIMSLKKRSQMPKDVYNPFGVLKDEVDDAITKRRTFTVRGCYPVIRQALIRRGWIEKVHASYREGDLRKYLTMTNQELLELSKRHSSTRLAQVAIKSKLLNYQQVDLFWSYNHAGYTECSDGIKLTWLNKIKWKSMSYTCKHGLCEASRQSFWFHLPGISKLNVPRSYRLAKEGDAEEFVKDFNTTAAMSLLKWVKSRCEVQHAKLMNTTGKVPLRMFDFAINECYKFLKRARHEDIDQEIKDALSHEWNEFLEYFYKIVHVGNLFKLEDHVTEVDMLRRANYVLERLRDYYPYLDMDGELNIWILKPTNSCRGIGIHMCRTLKYVLDTVKANPNRRYIIQKYIERPLLIYNTKFDIRQWFMISSTVPLTIWLYKVCYLRFSSQTYNLKKLHESIHLTNNSVQCKYRNAHQDPHLPTYCMWDSNEFRTYLIGKGQPSAFNDIVYPGMKECITAAVLMHHENMEKRRNTFEVYGADFILTEDFIPWLLEINANPALHASTPVTARLCPKLMEDVIKVVVDYERNKSANTGNFEMIYRATGKTDGPCREMKNMSVDGRPLNADYFYRSKWSPKDREAETTDWGLNRKIKNISRNPDTTDFGLVSVTGMKETLHSLLELLKNEKERRKAVKRRAIIEEPPYPFPMGVETWLEKRKST